MERDRRGNLIDPNNRNSPISFYHRNVFYLIDPISRWHTHTASSVQLSPWRAYFYPFLFSNQRLDIYRLDPSSPCKTINRGFPLFRKCEAYRRRNCTLMTRRIRINMDKEIFQDKESRQTSSQFSLNVSIVSIGAWCFEISA